MPHAGGAVPLHSRLGAGRQPGGSEVSLNPDLSGQVKNLPDAAWPEHPVAPAKHFPKPHRQTMSVMCMAPAGIFFDATCFIKLTSTLNGNFLWRDTVNAG